MKAIGASVGIGKGKAFIIKDQVIEINKSKITDVEGEITIFKNAQKESMKQVENLIKNISVDKVGKEQKAILNAHMELLSDPEFTKRIESEIMEKKLSASWVVDIISKEFISIFEAMDNEYMRERALDIQDISLRLQHNILGISFTDFSDMSDNTIIIAENLTPSDTIQLDKKKIKGFIVEKGGITSHTAILASVLGIPAIFGVPDILNIVKNDDIILMNGESGEFLINPDNNQIKKFQILKEKFDNEKNYYKKYIGQIATTIDGYIASTEANIGSIEELDIALENDAEGIGLFRTEFLFMSKNSLPKENEQFEIYKQVVEKAEGKRVVFRTLDIGGDKEISYLNLPKEQNPFLGYRAIRICLNEIKIFKNQLRALLRASNFGNLEIMFPMISSMDELLKAKNILEQVKAELREKAIDFNENIKIGLMIEIPSAAIISDMLAKEVDFFSIGTNDLMQYTYAVDRMNSKVSNLYSPYNPALLRLIKLIIDNAHSNHIKVGMCGELAAIPNMIPILVGMGLDELSTSPPAILKARAIISKTNKLDMEQFVEELLNTPTSEQVENKIIQTIK